MRVGAQNMLIENGRRRLLWVLGRYPPHFRLAPISGTPTAAARCLSRAWISDVRFTL